MLTCWVEFPGAIRDCSVNAVQVPVAVVEQEDGHPAVTALSTHIRPCCITTGRPGPPDERIPSFDVLHVAPVAPRKPEDKSVDALGVRVIGAACR